MTYGIKTIVTRSDLNETQERGIRKIGDNFMAINCGNIARFKSLRGATKWLSEQGYDAFGEVRQ